MKIKAIHLAAAVAAALLLGGCSWFSHKPAKPDADVAATATTVLADVDAGPAQPASSAQAAEASAAVAPSAQSPEAAVVDFLTMHQRLGNSGLPDAGSLDAYNAFLCPSLASALRDARVRQEQFRARNPDEKPPLVEGDLFSSLFEGPDSYSAAESKIDGPRATVKMDLRHGEGSGATTWQDSMLLELDDGIWCISDVEYGGKWPLANRGRLSDTLKQ